MRIYCRTHPDLGKPTGVRILKGNSGMGDSLTKVVEDGVILIDPRAEGTDLEAEFQWPRQSWKLLSKYNAPAQRFVPLGMFVRMERPSLAPL